MNYWDKKTVCKQLDKKLTHLKDFAAFDVPQQGWIKTIRDALGLSAKQLAKKTGMDQPRISRLERTEKQGNMTLATLQKIAQGLNMKFVYGFVPEESLEAMVKVQAKHIALNRLKRLNDTMRLEKQGLSDPEQEQALQDMIDKILVDPPKDFWD